MSSAVRLNEGEPAKVRPMDDRRVGAACRAMRRRTGWRQFDLARKAGCNQTTISRLECGFAATLSIATVRRVFAALGAGFDGAIVWRGGELDRLLDERHAELVEMAARTYRSRGWTVLPEATFSRYGERGSIDLLAVHERLKAAAVNEMKTGITSVEETIRRHDAKVRLATQIVFERFGWRPSAIGRVLILPEG